MIKEIILLANLSSGIITAFLLFMQEISLKALLEAGCHFGHKVERWHPKAASFIYGEKEGVHIIDLAKTKSALEAAAIAVRELAKAGKILLVIGTKRQARGVITEAAKKAGVFYLTNRWVGGFLTNWEEVRKNIDKLNKMKKESADGSWNQYPKHERVQLEKEMRKLEGVYGGVATMDRLPDAVYIVDIKKEDNAVKEAKRRNIIAIAIVDTNCDPTLIEYPIPANDDAVGSIKYISDYVVSAYEEGRGRGEEEAKKEEAKKNVPMDNVTMSQLEENKKIVMGQSNPSVEHKVSKVAKKEKTESMKAASTQEFKKMEDQKPKKRGRPKKIKV